GQDDDEETAKARYRDEYLWLARDHEFSERLRTRVTAVLTASERHRTGLLDVPGVASGTLDDQTEFDRVELTNLWTWEPRASITWTLGAEMASSRADYAYTRRAEYAPGVAAAFARPVNNDLDFAARPEVFTYAVHVAQRRQWRGFEAELGLRLDGQHYNLGGDHTQISPRLNVRYDMSDRLRIYASIGRFAQAQHVEEWRAEEAQPVSDAAQIAVHTIFGAAWEPSTATRWGLEAYSKRWTTVASYLDSQLDPLSLTPDLAPDRIRVTPSQSEASGLELNFRREFTDRLTGWGTASWSRVADDIRAAGNSHDVLRSWDQSLALAAGLGWQGARLNLSAFGAWHRGWPRTALRFAAPLAADADMPLVLGGRNRARWGDFYTLDLRASYLWPTAHGELSTVLELTNVTNRANECCAVLESAGDGYLQADTEHWLPAIVNLGFTYRWRNRH
ncbi:MAG TPA: TonB-dependent receptor, partial [Steroidobacteraceae bacterium]|nr:TonB-dependent receptor [Steroidobacteraceae bacterium]